MRIRYEYTEYKDCPEATIISEHRSRSALLQGGFASLLIIMGLVGFIYGLVSSPENIWMIILLIIGAVWEWYLFVAFPKKTEKLIEEAFKRQKEKNERLSKSKPKFIDYSCLGIMMTKDTLFGVCRICRKDNCRLINCGIKVEIGTKYRYMCRDCITKFQQNANK